MVVALAQGLHPSQYEFHAWFLEEGGPLADELEAAGATVRTFQWEGFRRNPAGAWPIWRALQQEEFAIVHQHFGRIAVQWLAHGVRGARLVVHVHGRESENRGFRPRLRCVVDADVVIATSQAAAGIAVGARPHVVYPGVHIPEGNGVKIFSTDSERTTIGTARRLTPIKGILYLLRAVAALHEEFPEVSLEIAGEGPQQPELEREAQRLGLAGHVQFLGWRSDLPALLPQWDIFVMPSLEEGFGVAALEAMAAGLPIVASAVGGIPELVQDGRTGWLVPPADPAALAQRLRELLHNPEQRRVMGAAGRARARERFSTDRMVAAIAKIYDDLLDPRSSHNGGSEPSSSSRRT